MKSSIRFNIVVLSLVLTLLLYAIDYDPQKYENVTQSETYDYINSNVNGKIIETCTFDIDQNGICRISQKRKAYPFAHINSEMKEQIIEEIKIVTDYSNRRSDFSEFTVNLEIGEAIDKSFCDVVYYYTFDTADLPEVIIDYNGVFDFGYAVWSENKRNFVKKVTKYNFNTFRISNWENLISGKLFVSKYLEDSDYNKIKSSIKKICEKEAIQYDFGAYVDILPKYTEKDKILKAFKHIIYLNKEKRETKDIEKEKKRKRKETLFD